MFQVPSRPTLARTGSAREPTDCRWPWAEATWGPSTSAECPVGPSARRWPPPSKSTSTVSAEKFNLFQVLSVDGIKTLLTEQKEQTITSVSLTCFLIFCDVVISQRFIPCDTLPVGGFILFHCARPKERTRPPLAWLNYKDVAKCGCETESTDCVSPISSSQRIPALCYPRGRVF